MWPGIFYVSNSHSYNFFATFFSSDKKIPYKISFKMIYHTCLGDCRFRLGEGGLRFGTPCILVVWNWWSNWGYDWQSRWVLVKCFVTTWTKIHFLLNRVHSFSCHLPRIKRIIPIDSLPLKFNRKTLCSISEHAPQPPFYHINSIW